MKHTTIIIAGQRFSKEELVLFFDDLAATSPLSARTEAWLVAQAIDTMELKAIERTLVALRELDEVRQLKAQLDGRRHESIVDTHACADEPEANDLRSAQLIKAIAKEVLG